MTEKFEGMKFESISDSMALSYLMGYLKCLANEHLRKDGQCFCDIGELLRIAGIETAPAESEAG